MRRLTSPPLSYTAVISAGTICPILLSSENMPKCRISKHDKIPSEHTPKGFLITNIAAALPAAAYLLYVFRSQSVTGTPSGHPQIFPRHRVPPPLPPVSTLYQSMTAIDEETLNELVTFSQQGY